MSGVTSVQKLLSLSSQPISKKALAIHIEDFENYGRLAEELRNLLHCTNGFYAFDSALHVFPAAPFEAAMTLSRWNSFGLWRREYGSLAEKKVFFAEDACGNQFCFQQDGIFFFDAETGAVEFLCKTVEDWAKKILADFETLTSYPALQLWQNHHGALPIGKRLLLKKPLALGGDYSLKNIAAVEAVEGMRLRGHIAVQIDGLPDGTRIDFHFTD